MSRSSNSGSSCSIAGAPDAARIAEVERIVQLSVHENRDKQQAIEYIGQLRSTSDKWHTGLTLLHFGATEVGRFFGLSLIKDFLLEVSCGSDERMEERSTVRSALLQWLEASLEALSSPTPAAGCIQPPRYLLNNSKSVLALCIKNDYPEHWASAFTELLQLGYKFNAVGIDYVAGVVDELEVEVVMFNENRTRQEIAHNTIVKDAMRESAVVESLLTFFCRGTEHLLTAATSTDAERRWEIAAASLHCVAEMVGWIDIHLVLNLALPTVGKAMTMFPELQDINNSSSNNSSSNSSSNKRRGDAFGSSLVRSAACQCVYELVRKGMDPVPKIQLVHSINLLALLLQMQSNYAQLLATVATSSSGRSRADSLTPTAEDDSLLKELQQWGALLDALAAELFGCWSKYEDFLWSQRRSAGNLLATGAVAGLSLDQSTLELINAIPAIVQYLTAVLPLLLDLFHHGKYGGLRAGSCRVSCSVLPACNKLVSLLKHQRQRESLIHTMKQQQQQQSMQQQQQQQQQQQSPRCFLAEEYLDALLLGIYQQSQYPPYFDFDAAAAEDDDVLDEVEAKDDVRKLFVNCCRAQPTRCLEMLTAVVSALSQPLSLVEATQLEAILRLLYAYSECGPTHNQMVAEGTFPAMIRALHETDITSHSNPHVVLAFFEVSQRYLKFLELPMLQQQARILVGPRGVCSDHKLLCSRSAYFVLKVVEGMEGKSAPLLPIIGAQLSEVLTAHAAADWQQILLSGSSPNCSNTTAVAATSMVSRAAGAITEQSEQYLCEAFALMTCSISKDQQPLEVQQTLLQSLLNAQSLLLQQAVSHPQLQSYWELLSAFMAQRIAAMSSLSKGFSLNSHGAFYHIFDAAAQTIVAAANSVAVSVAQLRQKVLVFLHRMVPAVGIRVTHYAMQTFPLLLQCAEKEDVCDAVQLLNQLMVEFQQNVFELVQQSFAPVVSKFEQLIESLEQLAVAGTHNAVAVDAATAATATAVEEAPHVRTERLQLYRGLLLFLQHAAVHNCAAVLHFPAHIHLLPNIFSTILMGIRGSVPVHRVDSSSGQTVLIAMERALSAQESVPLRKTAVIVITGMIDTWMKPQHDALAAVAAVDPQIVQGFRIFLQQHVLPNILRCIVASTAAVAGGAACDHQLDFIPLNVRDAASQSVLVELASLLRTAYLSIGFCGSIELNAQFLQQIMSSPPVNWEHGIVVEVLRLLQQTESPLGTFKDHFKQLMRKLPVTAAATPASTTTGGIS